MKKVYKILLAVLTMVMIIASTLSLTACTKPWVIEKDTMFYIDKSVGSTIMGIPFLIAIDDKQSGVLLKTDGTVKITLITNVLVSTLIALAPLDELQIDDDMRDLIDSMAVDYFPGFSISDPVGSLMLLEKSVNLKLVGLENEAFQESLNYFGKNGSLPEGFSIPKGLGIEYNSNYYFTKVKSHDQTEYIAVNVGNPGKGGEGPMVFTLSENEDGKRVLSFRFEVLDVYLEAVER